MGRAKVRPVDAIKVLDACVEQLKLSADGEACDHDVNVCWCSHFKAIEDAERMSARLKEEVGWKKD